MPARALIDSDSDKFFWDKSVYIGVIMPARAFIDSDVQTQTTMGHLLARLNARKGIC